MSSLTIAALLSILGAILFSLVGFLLALLLSDKKQLLKMIEQLSDLRDTLQDKLETAHKNQKSATKQISDLRDQIRQYAERQDKLIQKSQDLDGIAQEAGWLRNQAEVRLEEVESAFRIAKQKLEQSIADGHEREGYLNREVEALKADKIPQSEQVYVDLVEIQTSHDQCKKEVSRLEEEKAVLKEKLILVEQNQKRLSRVDERAKLMEKANLHFQLDIERLREDQKKLASEQEENAVLRQKLVQLDFLRQEVDRLRLEKSDYSSLCVAMDPEKEESTPPLIFDEEQGRGAAMQSALRRLMGLSKSQCAVISDHDGLLLAGEGDYTEELGLAGTGISISFDRLRHLLPISSLHNLVIVDQNQVFLSMQPFTTQAGTFFLVTLTVGGSPDPHVMQRTLKHLSSLID